MISTRSLGLPKAGLAYLLLFSLFGSAFGFAQYCHDPAPREHFAFCVAVDARLNASSSSTDLTVTFGYQKSNFGGWTAIGQGSGMYGALMFILGVSRGHFEPQPELSASLVETLSMKSNQTGWVEASFDCYGCGGSYEANEPQPWIWAAKKKQQLNHASVESKLDIHDHYGRFKLVLPQPHDKSRVIPVIDHSIPNQEHADSSGHLTMLKERHALVHGTLTTVSIAFLIPLGSIGCLLGVGFVVTKLEGPFPLLEPHVLIGSLVVCAILFQPVLGGLHMRSASLIYVAYFAALAVIWAVASLYLSQRPPASAEEDKEVDEPFL
ncbi:eukaryotic cytochrome b561 domain-containing [Fusarium longipes]|uniref:Eukaryotic cytochrome b561 domain-containing n=1 Tax=Fusarium longipes TaxID=694270 RepID=A0A395T4Z1_9HYPO|nr:eukaryotic cytochrome b561 domain-containing [Fusarium longipes]